MRNTRKLLPISCKVVEEWPIWLMIWLYMVVAYKSMIGLCMWYSHDWERKDWRLIETIASFAFSNFFGHDLSGQFITPSKVKVAAILIASSPQDVSQIRSFFKFFQTSHKKQNLYEGFWGRMSLLFGARKVISEVEGASCSGQYSCVLQGRLQHTHQSWYRTTCLGCCADRSSGWRMEGNRVRI